MDAKDYPDKPTVVAQVPRFQEGDEWMGCPTGTADVVVWKAADGRPQSRLVPREKD